MDEQIVAASELADDEDEGRGAVGLDTALILLASIGLATAGQLLLKAGMTDVGIIDGVTFGHLGELITSVVGSWKVLLGLAFFGLSAMFWLVTLSRVPLSTAYPVVSLSYVLILGFSTLVLGERPTVPVWVGAVLIMLGISFVGIGQR
ncbi:MAG: EamA family transporter [Nitriliruptorales bacterium]|nr:EamA family transporter [Nitriliruptorales bacterium]